MMPSEYMKSKEENRMHGSWAIACLPLPEVGVILISTSRFAIIAYSVSDFSE